MSETPKKPRRRRTPRAADRSPTASKDPLAQALIRLHQELVRELRGRPDAPLNPDSAGPTLTVDISLASSFDAEGGAKALRSALGRELEGILIEEKSFRPGFVPDLRGGSAEGREAGPPDSRFVFGGYGPSGRPRFIDFAQWLLQLDHPNQDRLYARPPGLVTARTSSAELYEDLLPAFEDPGRRIHGQVTAGWYEISAHDGHPAQLAVTFQILSTRAPRKAGRSGHPTRLGLNLLLAGPSGESADEVYARLEIVPWRSAVEWARRALSSVERSRDLRSPDKLEQRLQGILNGLARRLEQERRGRDRRTEHAETRHRSGRRPTREALKDLDNAQDREIFVDTRKDTLIVLGDKGRVHVFNRRGKLVTSIRYSLEAVERKQKAEIWCPAGPGEIRDLRRDAQGQGSAAEPTVP